MADTKTTTKKAPAKKVEAKTLTEQLVEKRDELREQTKSLRAGELVNPRVLRTSRKEVARILTAMKQEVRNGKESK